MVRRIIDRLRWLAVMFRFLGLIVFNKAGLNSKINRWLFVGYLKMKLRCLLPQTGGEKVRQSVFVGRNLRFFDWKTTTSLIESIFVKNEYFFSSKTDTPLIFDLGSNLGLSIIYLKLLYPNCKVIAFEPDKATFEVLRDNLANFSTKEVEVHNLAVMGCEGVVDFYVDSKSEGSPLMSTHKLRLPQGKKTKVRSTLISKWIKGRVDFVKMDIEGSELAVIEDLDKSGKTGLIEQLSIEYHHHIDTEDDQISRTFEILEKNNFGYQIHAGQNTPFALKSFEDIKIHAYNKTIYRGE